MNCAKARSVILLRESGDATRDELRALELHAGSCPECDAYAAGLQPLDLSSVRADLPLGDEDLAAIRASVMRDVRARAPRSRWIAILVPVAVAIVLALLATTVRRGPTPSPVSDVATRVAPPPFETPPAEPPEPSPVETVAPREAPPVEVATAPRRPAIRRAKRTPSPLPARAIVAAASTSPMRIEIHTADPNVRIIWIASQERTEQTSGRS